MKNYLDKKMMVHITLIFLVALTLRLIVFSAIFKHTDQYMDLDSQSYEHLAKNLIFNHSFSRSDSPPFVPDTIRTPLYPFFIAITYIIFGIKPYVVIFLQTIIATISCIITYFIGKKVLQPKAALLAGLIFALDPISIMYSNHFLSDTLFTFLLVLAMFFFIGFLTRKKTPLIILPSFLIGLSVLCRPVAQYFPLLLLPIIVFALYDRPSKAVKACMLFIGIFLLTISPWLTRNYMMTDKLIMSSIKDYNLFFYNAAKLIVQLDGVGNVRAHEILHEEATLLNQNHADNPSLNELRKFKEVNYLITDAKTLHQLDIYAEVARNEIKKHPLEYAKMHIKSGLLVLTQQDLQTFWATFGINFPGTNFVYQFYKLGIKKALYAGCTSHEFLFNSFPLLLYSFVLYFFSIFGITHLWKEKKFWLLVTIGILVFYFIFTAGPAGCARLRLPIAPFLSLLAATSLFEFARKCRTIIVSEKVLTFEIT